MDELMLSSADYARARGLSLRQVQRYLADRRLPGAFKHGGAWMIPATSEPTSHDVVAVAASTNSAEVLPVIFDPGPTLGRLVELDAAAAELGTTVGGVRRLGAAGLLTVGRFGPRGSLRVWIPA
jgi:hypothetical protein